MDDLEVELQRFGLSVGSEATGLSDTQKAALLEFASSRPHHRVAGGAAMNTLRVATWAGLQRAAFVGALGMDDAGQLIFEALKESGIVPLLKEVPDAKTGICGVLVDSKTRDRTLSMVRAAASMLDVAWLEMPQVSCLVKEASMKPGLLTKGFLLIQILHCFINLVWAVHKLIPPRFKICLCSNPRIYITSFVLTSQPRLAAAEALAQNATERGAWLALNLSSAGLLPRVKDALLLLGFCF